MTKIKNNKNIPSLFRHKSERIKIAKTFRHKPSLHVTKIKNNKNIPLVFRRKREKIKNIKNSLIKL